MKSLVLAMKDFSTREIWLHLHALMDVSLANQVAANNALHSLTFKMVTVFASSVTSTIPLYLKTQMDNTFKSLTQST